MTIDGDAFRKVLGSWASGVTIVTSRDGDYVHGMTVSAFCSVSLDPPLILVCADKSSNTNELIARTSVFEVNVLARGQEELSNRFASKKYEEVRFDGLTCSDGVTGCPRIPGAYATLDCRVTSAVDAGDHWVYIGQVEAASLNSGEPLVYFQGAYREFGAS